MTCPALGRFTAELTASIEQAVRARVGGSVRDVRAERVNDGIIVRGKSDSYYGLQMAIESVRPYLHGTAAVPVQLAIEVDRSRV